MSNKINIMIVDDSVVIRKILENMLSSVEEFEVVEVASDGQDAVDRLTSKDLAKSLDVIILDVEMPRLNGIQALPKLQQLSPRAKIIMASTLTRRNASVSLEAMELGAKDYIAKPSSSDAQEQERFAHELTSKIKAHGAVTARIRNRVNSTANKAEYKEVAKSVKENSTYPMAERSKRKPNALAIGSSTGGPDALLKVLTALDLNRISNIPVFITQHMPAHFTAMLAENISKKANVECAEGIDGEIVKNARIYIAPGDYHMEIVLNEQKQKIIRLNQKPQINFCRPSVDPMLNSLSAIYRDSLLVCILTGMGSDGSEGSKLSQKDGATIIAQDEETSIVYGMPAAVAKAGICSDILPLSKVADTIMEICK